MQYILTGFTQEIDFRIFAFQGIGEDKLRTDYRVRADLGLIRRYGIRVQELPLLCRGILERRDEGREQRAFTYTETEMGIHADGCAARHAAAKMKKTPRRPPPNQNLGTAWRGPQV